MWKNRFVFFILLCCLCHGSWGQHRNLALKLDGTDNDVRTGIGIVEAPWTLEAWIKGDDLHWKKLEVIFGGGEYSEIESADYFPLVLEDGHLVNRGSGLRAAQRLDDHWHHVAVTCDGNRTRLYIDGFIVAENGSVNAIIPGAIGIQYEPESVFGGMIDEIRIWKNAVDEKELRKWMARPLLPEHRYFKDLIAYYPLDESMGKMAVNWVGKGVSSYHLRNGRACYNANAAYTWSNPSRWKAFYENIDTPLACTVPACNPHFAEHTDKTKLFYAVTLCNEWDVRQGKRDEQLLKIRIALSGKSEKLELSQLVLDLSETDRLEDMESLHVYLDGPTPDARKRMELFKEGCTPQKKIRLKLKKPLYLGPGVHYILITADIASDAVPGNQIGVNIPSFVLGGQRYFPEKGTATYSKKVYADDSGNLRLLQWNIWHGGVHLGKDGIAEVINLMKATESDIITLQESYGAQERIGKELGMELVTPGWGDNLTVLSKYPVLQNVHSAYRFNSNPVVLAHPSGRKILVNSLWINAACNPEYTGNYHDKGMNPDDFIREDASRGLVDLKRIWTDDMMPIASSDSGMVMIMAGDFNSGSHLDWTAGAAEYHGGYGPVELPISKYMIEELGFTDSFRQSYPDEVLHHEGTFAVIYGQLQSNRIDFIYYKGRNVRNISSKIIRTTYEIDDVWPSDHAGVLTILDLK